jgi:hypothetical protein
MPLRSDHRVKAQTLLVIPAKAGIQWGVCGSECTLWIPAFAGMTLSCDSFTSSPLSDPDDRLHDSQSSLSYEEDDNTFDKGNRWNPSVPAAPGFVLGWSMHEGERI